MEPRADQWEKVKSFFEAALQRSSVEREQFLAENCADEGIRTEVLSLLHNHESAGSFLPSLPEQISVAAAARRSGKALPAKTRLGPYEITALLGAGGMGEVYRARDTRLDRSVAIKVLPEVFASDRDRLRRFEQEARAVAALNHPNILGVYDVGSQDGTSYVVCELLEGGTLRQQLAGGALPRRKAVEYAMQVAKGLSAAHEGGVVHRDLKPENIFVTKDGRVKILDFGLAKSFSRQASLTKTAISGETEPGVVLGTAGYMSPEQVRGESVNHLSDIFSFGAVLYEMLSGQRAFERDTNLETMSAILKEDVPELSTLKARVPAALSRIVRHCLEKNPEERFHAACDLAFDLEEVLDVSPSTTAPALNQRRSRLLVTMAITVAVAVIAIAAGLLARFESKPGGLTFRQLTFGRGLIYAARFTSDGRTTLYSARWNGDQSRIFMARGDSPNSLPIDPPGASLESVWPPGEMLIHVDSNGKDVLARVPLTGGTPRPIFEDVFSADISPTSHEAAIVKKSAGIDQVEYPPGRVIYSASASIHFPRFAPDGSLLAITEWPVRGDDRGWVTILDTSGHKRVSSSQFATMRGIAWSANGKEVWFTGAKSNDLRNVYAISFSGTERLVYQAPSPLTIRDISPTGQTLFTRDDVRWGVAGATASDPRERDFSQFGFSVAVDVSPDGKMLLFEEGNQAETFMIYLRRLDGSEAVRLGTGSAQAFSPDGKWILACTAKVPQQLFLIPIGVGDKRVLTDDSLNHTAAAWFPNGEQILFEGNEPGRPLRLYIQRLDGRHPTPLTPEGTSFLGHQQRMISPDGKSIFAYAPDGSPVIYTLNGGSPRQPKGFGTHDKLIGWALDTDVMYVRRSVEVGEFPSKIYRLNVQTGEKVLWKQIAPPDLAGFGFHSMMLTPDGKSYFYTYSRELSTLFLADGLR